MNIWNYIWHIYLHVAVLGSKRQMRFFLLAPFQGLLISQMGTNIYIQNWLEMDMTYVIIEGLSPGNIRLLEHIDRKNSIKIGMNFYKQIRGVCRWGEFEKRMFKRWQGAQCGQHKMHMTCDNFWKEGHGSSWAGFSMSWRRVWNYPYTHQVEVAERRFKNAVKRHWGSQLRIFPCHFLIPCPLKVSTMSQSISFLFDFVFNIPQNSPRA